MVHSEGSPEKKIHSNTGLPKKGRNMSNKQPNSTYKELEDKQQTSEQVKGRK